jgi:hypothetical protein
VVILALLPIALAAELSLHIDTKTLVVGQSVPVKVAVINGGSFGVPVLPVGKGLLAQFQGQSSQHVIVNFESTRITEYNFQLAATAEGRWSLGPVDLVVDGKRLHAPAVTIDVGAPPIDQGGEPVVATISDETPVLGQVVVYRFQFQYDKPLVNARWTRPEFPGFIPEVNAEPVQREYQLMQDGVATTIQTIEVPLVAAGTGVQTIQPAQLTAQFRAKNRRRRRSVDDLFGNSPFGLRGSTETRTLSTQPVSVSIGALPILGQPARYSGLVGQFKAKLRASTTQVKLGDSVTLEYILVGDGTLAGFKLPPPAETAGFRVYDDAPEIRTQLLDGRFRSQLTVRRAVVPEREGILVVPPIVVSTYDTEAEQYVVVSTGAVELTVVPGEEGGGVVSSYGQIQGDSREAVAAIDQDILPVIAPGGVRDRTLKGATVILSSAVALPGTVWGLLTMFGWLRSRRPAPFAVLKARLADLPSAPDQRLASLESIFRGTVAELLGVAVHGLNGQQVEGLSSEAASLYADFERARYGGGAVADLEARVNGFVRGAR